MISPIEPKKILLISASRVSKDRLNSTPLFQSIQYIQDQVKLIMFPENLKGLPEIYNEHISHHLKENHDIIAFIHDDVSIEDSMFQKKMYQATQHKSIIGIAGTSEITIGKPALWHKMSLNEIYWSGAVAHPFQGGIRMTHFGTSPKDCIVLDGLFIAARLIDLLQNNIFFDTQFKFHHYDLDFCIQAHLKGLQISTWPIWMYHNSPGLASINDPAFRSSEKLFVQKYQKH
jgi:GT2 family glycosyltransferase